MSLTGLSNDAFARAVRTLGRSSVASAESAAMRADRLPDHSRRWGSEIQIDGFVSRGEMEEFGKLGLGTAQGLTASEKRLTDAARVLYKAMFEAQATPFQVVTQPPQISWKKEVSISTLSGPLQVKNSQTGTVVLETDLKKFAQRIAGPGQKTIGPDDFAKALPLLTPDEHYLAKELFNQLYFSKPLATFDSTGLTPGGHAAKVSTVATGYGDLPTGGYQPTGNVTYAIEFRHTLELSLKPREVVVDLKSGDTFTPDQNGKVSIPDPSGRDLAIVTRGVKGQVHERLTWAEPAGAEGGVVF
jgi:hypothetical protein